MPPSLVIPEPMDVDLDMGGDSPPRDFSNDFFSPDSGDEETSSEYKELVQKWVADYVTQSQVSSMQHFCPIHLILFSSICSIITKL